MHLKAKFHHPTFNHLEVIVQTNRQTDKLTNKLTPLKTSTSLRYTTLVGNNQLDFLLSSSMTACHALHTSSLMTALPAEKSSFRLIVVH